METNLLEDMNVKADLPQDIDGGLTGARVPMANATKVTFIVLLAGATSATANTVALKQHNASSSGTTKAVEVTNPYYHKINAATAFTKVDVETAEDTFDLHAAIGDNVATLVFEVQAEELDRANGFNHVSVDLGDPGVARYASVVALVDGAFHPAYGGDI